MGEPAYHISAGGKNWVRKAEFTNPQSIYFSKPSISGADDRTIDQATKTTKKSISSKRRNLNIF